MFWLHSFYLIRNYWYIISTTFCRFVFISSMYMMWCIRAISTSERQWVWILQGGCCHQARGSCMGPTAETCMWGDQGQ